MRKLFGTDGIRGRAGTELDAALARDVGRAIAAATAQGALGALGAPVPRPHIVVGRDTRTSGPALEAALVDGLTSAGADVSLCGVLPTAGVAFLVGDHSADAGVVISASHNPPPDNGIKVLGPGGWKLAPRAEREIEALVGADIGTRTAGSVAELGSARERYVEHIIASVRTDLRGSRVVIDCANGAASGVAPDALSCLGADVIALNADGDGARINENSGALHPEVVARAAKREDAVGLTFDGDADRVLVADEDGNVVDGDGVLGLLAAHMRAAGELAGDGIVVTVMSNQALRRWCLSEGIKLVETPVGDRFVLEALRDNGMVLGGEQAGHILRLDQATTGDGILIGLEVLAIACGARLADLVPFRSLPQVLVNVRTGGANGVEDRAPVRAAIAEVERKLGSDGRILVRPSGTEPVVRVMVEAADETVARELADIVAEAVHQEVE